MMFLLLPVRVVVDAWALWLMWAWFVVPLGAPRLPFWHAAGLDTLAGLILAATISYVEDDADKRRNLSLAKLAVVPVFVGMGWCIRWLWLST